MSKIKDMVIDQMNAEPPFDPRYQTMLDLAEMIRRARSEDVGLPLSTIATVIAENMGDLEEVRVLITRLEDYLQ